MPDKLATQGIFDDDEMQCGSSGKVPLVSHFSQPWVAEVCRDREQHSVSVASECHGRNTCGKGHEKAAVLHLIRNSPLLEAEMVYVSDCGTAHLFTLFLSPSSLVTGSLIHLLSLSHCRVCVYVCVCFCMSSSFLHTLPLAHTSVFLSHYAPSSSHLWYSQQI